MSLPCRRNAIGSALDDFHFDLDSAARGARWPVRPRELPRSDGGARRAGCAGRCDCGRRRKSSHGRLGDEMQRFSAIRGHFDLLRMNQRHFGRGIQKIADNVCGCSGTRPGAGPHRDAQIRLPRFLAELPPLDLERLLPAKILRLFVRQDFLRDRRPRPWLSVLPDDHLVLKLDSVGGAHALAHIVNQFQHVGASGVCGIHKKIRVAVADHRVADAMAL